jgi:molecular chaperone DnaK
MGKITGFKEYERNTPKYLPVPERIRNYQEFTVPLGKEEVERMRREADLHAQEDSRRREEVESRNTADSLAYQAEKTVTESGDKLPADIRAEIETGVKDVRDALEAGASADLISAARDRLMAALQKAGAALYEQQGEDGMPPREGEPGTNGEAPAEEPAVEGEYREV